MKKTTRAELLLLLTALIWGFGFVAQDVASGSVQPFTFNGVRMAMAALVVLAFSLYTDHQAGKHGARDYESTGSGVPFAQMTRPQRKMLVIGGVLCGVLLALASNLQQMGITAGSSAGKAGFITALYIVLVPLAGFFFGKKPRLVICIAVVLSVIGLYLLCITEEFSIQASDIYLILCALCFSGHIMVIDHFSCRTDSIKMSCIQFFVADILCLILAFALETPRWSDIQSCMAPLLYAGVLSGGAGYTLQIVGQRDVNPTIASLIMCLESVFAVLGGWLLLGDQMSAREYIGCFSMLCGILLAQMPEKKPLAQMG